MREICIPIQTKGSAIRTDLEVTQPGKGPAVKYRLEHLEITLVSNTGAAALNRAVRLQQYIAAYDSDWELLQILDTGEKRNCMYLLFRKK